MKGFQFLAAIVVFVFAPNFSVSAQQYDDVYYDPTKVVTTTTTTTTTEEYSDNNDFQSEDYDDEYYDEDDEYDYQYSTRIRRFHHRNQIVYDYYDPFFVDAWQYDPYYMPGTSIYVVNNNDWWRYRRFNRWNRRNHFGWGYNSWNPYDNGCGFNAFGPPVYGGWGNPYSFHNPWNNGFVFNNYCFDPYWSYSGWNTYYCPPNYGHGFGNNGGWYSGGHNGGFNNGGNNIPVTYSGPRRSGTIKQPPGLVSTTGNGKGRHEIETMPTKEPHGRVIRTDRDPKTAPGSSEQTSRRPDSPKSEQTESRPSRQERAPMTDDDNRSRPKTETVPQPTRRRSDASETETRPTRRSERSEPTRKDESRQRSNNETRERPQRQERQERSYEAPRQERSKDSGGSSRGSSSGSGSSKSSSGGGKKGRD